MKTTTRKSPRASTKASGGQRRGRKANAARLSDKAKRFIVEALVCRVAPESVQGRLREEFGIAVSLNAVRAFDPTLGMARLPAKRWRDLFHRSRSALDKGLQDLRSPEPRIQLRGLVRVIRRGKAARDVVGVAECEQAFSKIARSWRESILKNVGMEWLLREGDLERDLDEQQSCSTAVPPASSPS